MRRQRLRSLELGGGQCAPLPALVGKAAQQGRPHVFHPLLNFLGGVELQQHACQKSSLLLLVLVAALVPHHPPHPPGAGAPGAQGMHVQGAALTESQPSASFSIAVETLMACCRVLKSMSCTEISLTSTEQKFTSLAVEG